MRVRRVACLLIAAVALLTCASASAGAGSIIEQQDYGPVFSPDGTQIAFRRVVTAFYGGAPAPHVFVMPAAGGPARDLGVAFPLGTGEDSISWTPEGRSVVFQSFGVKVARADGSSVETVDPGSAFLDTSSAPVSPDGWLTFVTNAPQGQVATIRLERLDGSEERMVIAADDSRLPAAGNPRFFSATFSPDGRRIAFVYGDGVWAVDRDGSNLRLLDSGAHPNAYGAVVSWSPDGERLVYLGSGGFHVVDSHGARFLSAASPSVGFGSVSWSPTGDRLLLPAENGYRLVSTEGTVLGELAVPDTSVANNSRYSSWSPDGSSIALNESVEGCRTTSLALAFAPLGAPRVVTADCRIAGTRRSDHIVGNELSNVIHGFAGGDVINGGPGNDSIYGDAGNDVLDSGARGGILDGGAGNDRLVAHKGDDVLVGGPGKDVIHAGAGQDRVLARDGYRDVVDCGPGLDRAIVDARDVVRGCESVVR